jgi:hypothetical protein
MSLLSQLIDELKALYHKTIQDKKQALLMKGLTFLFVI